MAGSTENIEREFDPTGHGVDSRDSLSPEQLQSLAQEVEVLNRSPLELAPILIKAGVVKQEAGQHAEAEELFLKALNLSERELGLDHPRLVPALTSLGALLILRGTPEEAELFFSRALTITERHLGHDHPDLVILLNDLTRLYLRQAAYSCAEPLLHRLLAMKQSKGEDHPEVATVLASLAVVRQALGRHESAEQLWRRVLEIRERTLAPNHFALVTAIEHLADVCSARGKLREALELFRRAQAIRELTLGADHSSLRISRERVADLELQASGDFLNPQDREALIPAPDTQRLMPIERLATPITALSTIERTPAVGVWSTLPAVEHSTRLVEPLIEDHRRAIGSEAVPGVPRESEVVAVPYRDLLISIGQELDSSYERETLSDRTGVIFASVIELVQRRQKEVVSIAAVTALVLIALATSSRASSGELTATELSSVAAASLAEARNRSLPASRDAGKVSATQAAIPTQDLARVASRAVDNRGPGRTGDRRPNQADLPLPAVSMDHLDSVVRAVNAPSVTIEELAPIEPTSGIIEMPRPRFDDVESEGSQPVHARLIGEVPVPRYPEALSRSGVDGEVRVLFTVDTAGHPVMSTFMAEGSPNKLLTAAVRKVIPGMRFHPARTAAPESNPVVETVHIRFRFARTK